jgi:hypothetical protein
MTAISTAPAASARPTTPAAAGSIQLFDSRRVCSVQLPPGFAEAPPGSGNFRSERGDALGRLLGNRSGGAAMQGAQLLAGAQSLLGQFGGTLQGVQQSASRQSADTAQLGFTANRAGSNGQGSISVRRFGSTVCALVFYADASATPPFATTFPALVASVQPNTEPVTGSAAASGGPNCARPSVGFPPLTDPGSGTYQGFMGGLYPDGSNQPPTVYAAAGLAHAQAITPLDATGQPDPVGRVVLLSVGMSNATAEYSAFKRLADADARKNPHLAIVDGAQGGADAVAIKAASARYWTISDQRLQKAGVSPAQVQAIWLKEAIAGENHPFPADAKRLQTDLAAIVGVIARRYPNVQLIYLSSRTYAGYAVTALNPEPHAYDSGFAVKWLIQEAIQQSGPGAWIGWGPYLWTDGEKGRRDGLVWTCADVASDGTHPSGSGIQKVARLLLQFFTTDPTAKTWFTR